MTDLLFYYILSDASYDRCICAEHPNVTIEILVYLSNDIDWRVRQNVAKNLNTPSRILEHLSTDKVTWVVEAVAGNTNAPLYILEKLSLNDDRIVRKAVAGNISITKEIHKTLCYDKVEMVRYCAYLNKKLDCREYTQIHDFETKN